jgi:hypothetical protein
VSEGRIVFGPFHLDIRERRLSRGCDVIPLRLKVFDTLRVLVENAGRLVTKQELLDTVWPETTVEEDNLNHNVSVLRKSLGDQTTDQQYIGTMPRVPNCHYWPFAHRSRRSSTRVRSRRIHAGLPLGATQRRARESESSGSQPIRRVLNTCLYLGLRADRADRPCHPAS